MSSLATTRLNVIWFFYFVNLTLKAVKLILLVLYRVTLMFPCPQINKLFKPKLSLLVFVSFNNHE